MILGPCVLETAAASLDLARKLAGLCKARGLPLVFKASFDKANRTSHASQRGPGLDEGLMILQRIRQETGLPVTTDVHEVGQVAEVAEVADLVQVPAFLCRQTDLIAACARCGKPVSVKKGQFLAPWDCRSVVEKFRACGGRDLVLIERGTSFGYNNLVVDLRGLPIMRGFQVPVVFDATHSVQQPGGLGSTSGGDGRYAPALIRAALAVGVEGIFAETHPDPAHSPSDGPNMIPLANMGRVLDQVLRLHEAIGRPAPLE